MTDTVADVAATYFDAWKRGDFTRLRAILADDVTFHGPRAMPATRRSASPGSSVCRRS
ncbi:MAG TPA: nuclear transport factor 2 family protein [Streptosporangiaceae bacterium]|jgi:ketosteroid isomerase-like protein